MTKPPSFDHVTSRTNPHPPLSNQVLYQSNASRHKAGAGSKMGKNPNHQNHSVLSNASAMNFYPPFLQPTRMSDIVGAGSSNGSSNRAPSTRTSLKYSSSQSAAKSVSFYRSGDTQMQVNLFAPILLITTACFSIALLFRNKISSSLHATFSTVCSCVGVKSFEASSLLVVCFLNRSLF